MSKLMTNLVMAMAATGIAAGSMADSSAAKAAYHAAADKAAADYRDAHAQCETLNKSVRIICIEEAKLTQTRVKGNAEAQYKNTGQARLKARTDIANAEYTVAKAKCELMEGSDKNICIKQADALRMAAIAEAKASLQTVGTRK